MLQQPAGPLNILQQPAGPEVTQQPQGVWQQLRHAVSQILQSCGSASQAATPLTVEERNEAKRVYRNDPKFLFNLLLGQPRPVEQAIQSDCPNHSQTAHPEGMQKHPAGPLNLNQQPASPQGICNSLKEFGNRRLVIKLLIHVVPLQRLSHKKLPRGLLPLRSIPSQKQILN